MFCNLLRKGFLFSLTTLLLASCGGSGGGGSGGSGSSTSVVSGASVVSTTQVAQAEIQNINQELNQDPQYQITQDDLNELQDSGVINQAGQTELQALASQN